MNEWSPSPQRSVCEPLRQHCPRKNGRRRQTTQSYTLLRKRTSLHWTIADRCSILLYFDVATKQGRL